MLARPDVLMPVPQGAPRRWQASRDDRRLARRPCGRVHSWPTWTRPQAGYSIPVQKWIVHWAGKSIIQLLWGEHQMTGGGLQLSSLSLIFEL